MLPEVSGSGEAGVQQGTFSPSKQIVGLQCLGRRTSDPVLPF